PRLRAHAAAGGVAAPRHRVAVRDPRRPRPRVGVPPRPGGPPPPAQVVEPPAGRHRRPGAGGRPPPGAARPPVTPLGVPRQRSTLDAQRTRPRSIRWGPRPP